MKNIVREPTNDGVNYPTYPQLVFFLGFLLSEGTTASIFLPSSHIFEGARLASIPLFHPLVICNHLVSMIPTMLIVINIQGVLTLPFM